MTPRLPDRMLTADQYRARAAAEMTEAVLQQRVQELATTLGWAWWHAPDNRPIRAKSGRTYVQNITPGWPDLVLVRRGRILYRELKAQTGRVRPDQTRCLALLEEAGGDVGVWRPSDLLSGAIAADLTKE